jgi:hypothetical protein
MVGYDTYEIRIRGWIDRHWSAWFDGLTMRYEGTETHSPLTVLTGPVIDQAALRGILCRIWDLNLTLLSVVRVETDSDYNATTDQER